MPMLRVQMECRKHVHPPNDEVAQKQEWPNKIVDLGMGLKIIDSRRNMPIALFSPVRSRFGGTAALHEAPE